VRVKDIPDIELFKSFVRIHNQESSEGDLSIW
jgi:hypothetical protein